MKLKKGYCWRKKKLTEFEATERKWDKNPSHLAQDKNTDMRVEVEGMRKEANLQRRQEK